MLIDILNFPTPPGIGYIAGPCRVLSAPSGGHIIDLFTREPRQWIRSTLSSHRDGTYAFGALELGIEYNVEGRHATRGYEDRIAGAVAASTRPLVGDATVRVPVGLPFDYQVRVDYGAAPVGVSISGALPSGLSVAGGKISGAWPTGTPGLYPLTVLATDANEEQASASIVLQLVLLPLRLSPAALPPIFLGVPFSANFLAAGGEGPYTYSVSSGALPAGLSLDSVTGELAGTPTIGGAYSFTVEAEDARSGAVSLVYAGSVAEPRKHWRVYITANNGGSYTCITEIEMYAGASANLCAGGTATASTEYDANYSAAKAIDGTKSGDNGWSTTIGNTAPSWLAIEMTSAALVDSVSIWGYIQSDQAIKDFDIQSSADGSTWTTEWSVTGQTAWGINEMRTFTRP